MKICRLGRIGMLGGFLWLGAGCATRSGTADRVGGLRVGTGGEVRFRGAVVETETVPAVLRRAGVRSGDALRIDVAGNVDRATLHALTTVLNRQGYYKILFVRPRRVTVEVGDE